MRFRVGLGYDIHPFGTEAPLVLGGVRIDESARLAGHSDGDAVAHAVADAILGAAGSPDLGTLYPAGDDQWRDADSLGLLAEDYENDRVLIKDLYTGMIELSVSVEKMAAFRANGELELNNGKQYFPNEYCTLTEEGNPKRTALTKVDATGTKLISIIDCREGIWGIKPRNKEQHFAFDALLDDRVKRLG